MPPVAESTRVSLPSQITAEASMHMMMFDSEMTDDSLGSIEQPAFNNSDDSSSDDDTSDHDTSDDTSDDNSDISDDSSSDDDTSDHETSDGNSDDGTLDSDTETSDDDSSDDNSVHDSIDDQSTENGTLLASINPEPVSYDVPEPMDESSIQDEVPDASVHMDEAMTYEILKGSSQRQKDKLVDSDGFTYNIKRRRGPTVYWQCVVRNKTTNCRATIIECGGELHHWDSCPYPSWAARDSYSP